MSARRCRAKTPNKACPSVKVDCSRTSGHAGPHQFKLHGVVLQSWKNTARSKATARPVCPDCGGCYADGPCVCARGCDRAHGPWPAAK
ncbi:hypothetical protein FK529_05385 [Tsukamurella asaccharolytica]|uniref:Uncharacterized protein n=1 Tax=Tsukamurella asaccharolytica TaxID=2592067 RepID=A0A5C5RDK6_9ACTN|nr:hypothetical protein [Tsukamurella asaccharolytica]TWS20762.1 hypothetical protein FK529_05385 [Tsukamurella asaccharolytica]